MKSIFLLAFVLAAFPLSSKAENASSTPVVFKSRDGMELKGLWIPPEAGKPVVICLHGLGSDKNEWAPLVNRLHFNGIGALIYDARGHGQSSKEPEGYRHMGPPGPGSQWERMIDDAGGAVYFVTSTYGIAREKIFLVGASLGANVALNYAALARAFAGVIVLSPGLNYQEIRTEQAVTKIKIPILTVVSSADEYAFSSSRELKKLQPAMDLWTDVKKGHGVQMFDESLLSQLTAWIKKKS